MTTSQTWRLSHLHFFSFSPYSAVSEFCDLSTDYGIKMKSTAPEQLASTKDATSAIDNTIDYKLGVLRKALDRYSSPLVTSQFGLSLAEWRVMSHIHAGELVTASWLCERLLADKAEVSRACSSLIERGHVQRRKNANDGRSHLLQLSRSGKRLYDQILASRLALDAELKQLLTRDQKAALFNALELLTAHMLKKSLGQGGSQTSHE